MRTSRLSRWLISGALAATGVVVAFGGPAAGSDTGAQAQTVESAQEDVTVQQAQDEPADGRDPVTNDGYDWG